MSQLAFCNLLLAVLAVESILFQVQVHIEKTGNTVMLLLL